MNKENEMSPIELKSGEMALVISKDFNVVVYGNLSDEDYSPDMDINDVPDVYKLINALAIYSRQESMRQEMINFFMLRLKLYNANEYPTKQVQ